MLTPYIKSEISVPLKIENQECSLQLDTGCSLSLAPQTFYEQFCSHIPLKPTAVRLSTNTGEKVQPLGQIARSSVASNTIKFGT